jgi:hypothetical protein
MLPTARSIAMRIFVWNYMDPVKYPNPVDPKHTRVLYSEAYGTIAKNGTPVVDGTGKAPLVHVRAGARIVLMACS